MNRQLKEDRELLCGSQAVARGALEAGARLAVGYPGTPTTPAISYLIDNHSAELKSEWAVNEKVALEIAIGHSWAGQASFVAMKMSGLNVASDPLLSLATSGTPGALVILVGDDPGAYYGMVEQDSRHIARLAQLPMVEPSTPDEARRITRTAFEVSENLQVPILIRQTTTTASTFAPVLLEEPHRTNRKSRLPDDLARYTKVSASDCKRQHQEALDRLSAAAEALDHLNTLVEGKGKLGVVASGSTWCYVQEALERRKEGPLKSGGKAAHHALKVAVVNPMPDEKLVTLLKSCDRVLVIEELEPLIEHHLRALAFELKCDVEIIGKKEGHTSPIGDLDPDTVEAALCALEGTAAAVSEPAPDLSGYAPRVPTFCPGCPHRSTYAALLKAIKACGHDPDEVLVTGDIGCTILGMNEPFNLCRTELVMGASIAMAQGFRYSGIRKPIIAAIGDSTFYHAAIPALLNASARDINLTVLVLDNSCTAMTGFQPSLGTESKANDLVSVPLGIAELARAARVRKVRRSTPFFTNRFSRVLSQAIKSQGVNVVVAEGPCASRRLIKKVIPYRVRTERCIGLGSCDPSCLSATGCPAIFKSEDGSTAYIDETRCMGCGLCVHSCKEKAITRKGRKLRFKR